MSFVPQQNWPAYHSLVEPIQIEKDRLLSPSQKLQKYAEIFDSVWSLKLRKQNVGSVVSMEDEKLIRRERLLLAYRNVLDPSCE